MLKSLAIATLVLVPLSVSALTAEEIQSQIQALLQQIAALEAQVQTGNTTTTTTNTNTTAAYCSTLTRTLQKGSRDSTTQGEVSELQKFLAGYFNINPSEIVTGYFGNITQARIIQFQREKGISQTGIVGPLTRAAIKAACSTTATTQTTTQSCTFNNQYVSHGTAVTAYLRPTVGYGNFCTEESRACVNGYLYGSYQYLSCTVSEATNQSCAFGNQTIESGSTVLVYESASVPYNKTCHSQIRTCDNGSLSGSYTNTLCTVQPPPAYSQASYYSQGAYGGGTTGGGTTANVTTPGVTFTATPTSGAAPLSVTFRLVTTIPIQANAFDYGDGSPFEYPPMGCLDVCTGGNIHVYTSRGTYTARAFSSATQATAATVTITVH